MLLGLFDTEHRPLLFSKIAEESTQECKVLRWHKNIPKHSTRFSHLSRLS